MRRLKREAECRQQYAYEAQQEEHTMRKKNSKQRLSLEGAFTRMEVGKLNHLHDYPLATRDRKASKSLSTLSKRVMRGSRRRKG